MYKSITAKKEIYLRSKSSGAKREFGLPLYFPVGPWPTQIDRNLRLCCHLVLTKYGTMGSAIRIYRKWHPWQGTRIAPLFKGNTNNTTTKWQEVGLYLLLYKYGDLRYGHMQHGDLHLTQCQCDIAVDIFHPGWKYIYVCIHMDIVYMYNTDLCIPGRKNQFCFFGYFC